MDLAEAEDLRGVRRRAVVDLQLRVALERPAGDVKAPRADVRDEPEEIEVIVGRLERPEHRPAAGAGPQLDRGPVGVDAVPHVQAQERTGQEDCVLRAGDGY